MNKLRAPALLQLNNDASNAPGAFLCFVRPRLFLQTAILELVEINFSPPAKGALRVRKKCRERDIPPAAPGF